MIKATYTMTRALTARSVLARFDPFMHLRSYFMHYFVMCVAVGLLIRLSEGTLDDHASTMLAPAAVCAAIFALISRHQWVKQQRDGAPNYTFEVELDDAGVRSRILPVEELTPWSRYLWYEDLDDALLFKHQSGVFSIVPKNEATAEVIAFARSKVSPRYPKVG